MSNFLNNPLVNVLLNTVVTGVKEAAAKNTNDLSSNAVRGAEGDIKDAVEKQIKNSPELQHVTNTEAWYQKRSRWSAIIGVVTTVAAPVAAYYGIGIGTEEKELATTIVTGVGGLVAAWLAYRAGTATKPLGT